MLLNPAFSLPAFGQVKDLKSSKKVQYDPFRLAPKLHSTTLNWVGNTPRDPSTGMALFLLLLSGRQMGKSWVSEGAFYPRIANVPGYSHVCIADRRSRAEKLHKRIHYLDRNWPDQLKGRRDNLSERRKITFTPDTGGEALILSAQNAADGLGDNFQSLHLSEVAFFPDLNEVLTYTLPAIENVEDGIIIAECTPAPQGSVAPSADQWRDLFDLGMTGEGRWRSVFIPFFDSQVARRPWPKGSKMDSEEETLFSAFSPLGLEMENLAFRRECMATVPDIKANPDLFNVFYPFDPITCWRVVKGGTFEQRHLDILLRGIISQSRESHLVFKDPSPGARYLVSVDPAGQTGKNDHVGLHVWELWDDRIEQVVEIDAQMDQEMCGSLIEELSNRYNGAKIAIENTGVGLGVMMYLKEHGLRGRLLTYWPEKENYYGFPASTKTIEESISAVKLAIAEGLVIVHSGRLINQLQTYRNDKMLQQTSRQLLLSEARGSEAKHLRPKGHWDICSSFVLGIWAALKFVNRPIRVVAAKKRGPSWDDVDWDAWYANRVAGGPVAQKNQWDYTPLED
jgi:hypothetical protein